MGRILGVEISEAKSLNVSVRTPMNIQWMPQLNDERKQCAKCGAPIKPFTNYFRATRDPDGGDEFGYDVCAKCRKELPDVPELTAKA